MNQTQNQNPSVTISLTAQEINVILAALQEVPYRIADPVLKTIVPQVQSAQQSAQ